MSGQLLLRIERSRYTTNIFREQNQLDLAVDRKEEVGVSFCPGELEW